MGNLTITRVAGCGPWAYNVVNPRTVGERSPERLPMADRAQANKQKLETVEPLGKRVLIRKDEDKKVTKGGIALPDSLEIPTITGRVVAVSAQIEADENFPIRQYDKVLFNPKQAVPVEFEKDNYLYVVPIEDVVAVFRKMT